MCAPTRTVLIIEDDPLFLSIINHLLTPWPVDVVTASSIKSATALMRERTFDLYLIDHRLPDGDSSDLFSFGAGNPGALESRCVAVTSFPIVAGYMLPFPIVDKRSLHSLWPHLVRILGPPPQKLGAIGSSAGTAAHPEPS